MGSRDATEILGLLRLTWSLAIALLPAVAFLVVVHRTILAAFLQPAGLSVAKETVHIIATRIENRILR